jgi:hypothetical protein
MKANEGVQIWLTWFLNWALGLGECLASRPGRFTSEKEPVVIIEWESGWTPQRSRRCEDGNLLLLLGIEPRILFRPARSLVTAWTQQFQVLTLVCYNYFLVILVKVRQFLKLDTVWASEMRCTLTYVLGMLSWRWYSNGRFLSRYSTRQTGMWKEKFPQVGRALFMPL